MAKLSSECRLRRNESRDEAAVRWTSDTATHDSRRHDAYLLQEGHVLALSTERTLSYLGWPADTGQRHRPLPGMQIDRPSCCTVQSFGRSRTLDGAGLSREHEWVGRRNRADALAIERDVGAVQRSGDNDAR